MEYLHTMVRISDVDASVKFFCEGLGLKELRRVDSEEGKFTLIFLASEADLARSGLTGLEYPLPAGLPMVELTHNWGEAGYDAQLHDDASTDLPQGLPPPEPLD